MPAGSAPRNHHRLVSGAALPHRPEREPPRGPDTCCGADCYRRAGASAATLEDCRSVPRPGLAGSQAGRYQVTATRRGFFPGSLVDRTLADAILPLWRTACDADRARTPLPPANRTRCTGLLRRFIRQRGGSNAWTATSGSCATLAWTARYIWTQACTHFGRTSSPPRTSTSSHSRDLGSGMTQSVR